MPSYLSFRVYVQVNCKNGGQCILGSRALGFRVEGWGLRVEGWWGVEKSVKIVERKNTVVKLLFATPLPTECDLASSKSCAASPWKLPTFFTFLLPFALVASASLLCPLIVANWTVGLPCNAAADGHCHLVPTIPANNIVLWPIVTAVDSNNLICTNKKSTADWHCH